MRVSSNYIALLRRLGSTVTIRELHEDPAREGVGMRHDVDYSLERAVAVARAEAEEGCRSTYYLLPTAPYWADEDFDSQCRELESLGHEVGMHANFLAQWYRGEVVGLAEGIDEATRRLRDTGVALTGWAAHGDPDCYRGQFANYWHDSDVKPEDPMERESGISAEGVRDGRPRFQLRYPSDEALRNVKGEELKLWSVSMGRFGYEYHAVHVPHDQYFSDSGGSWRRGGNPERSHYSGGRWQILVHPEYWIAKPRVFLYTGGVSLKSHPERWKLIDFRQEGRSVEGSAEAGESLASLSSLVSSNSDTMIYHLPESLVPASVGRATRWKAGLVGNPELEELVPGDGCARERLYLERTGRRRSMRVDRHVYSVDRSEKVPVRSTQVDVCSTEPALMEAYMPLQGWKAWSVLRPWAEEVQFECVMEYDAPESPGALYVALRKAEDTGKHGGKLWGVPRRIRKKPPKIWESKTFLRVSSLPEGRRRITFRMTRPPGVVEIAPVIRNRGTKMEIRIVGISMAPRYGGIPGEGIQVVSIESPQTEVCDVA